MNKLQIAEQLRKALQMFATTLNDEKAMEIATIYNQWKIGASYVANDIVTYGTNEVGDPQLYRVITSHTSKADQTPDNSALFSAIGLDESGHVVWSQPAGTYDAYNRGDIVNYNGVLYRSKIDGNEDIPEAYPANWEVL